MNGVTVDNKMIDIAQKAIERGERIKILSELIVETLGFSKDEEIDIIAEIRKSAEEYKEGIKLFAQIHMEARKNTPDKINGVS